jgi:hypothetical protein
VTFCGGFRVNDERRAFTPVAVEEADVLRFGGQGVPAWLYPLPEREQRETPDGVLMGFDHELYCYLDPAIPEGESRDELKRELMGIWRDSKGWARARVWVRFTERPENFPNRVCVVKVLPVGDETCGNAGTSCVWISSRTVNRVTTRKITMNLKLNHLRWGPRVTTHELGHVLGACDMYRFENEPGYTSTYSGVMDAGLDATDWPTDHDIRETRAKFRGEARYPSCGYPSKATEG